MGVGGIARATVNSLPGVNLGPGEGELPSASVAENAQFNALVVVPNALQGLFRRRRGAVRAATRADVDRWAVRLLRGMRRTYRGSPVWVRVGPSPALLLLDVADVRTALEGSPDPFASDPEAKRKGMSHFQPDALTISRDGEWESRRPFHEAVLATGERPHPLRERIEAVVAEEVGAPGTIDWEVWSAAFQRIARRIVLGDAARDDEELTSRLARMMDEANSLPDGPSEELRAHLDGIQRYADAAEKGSLVARFAGAPADEETAPLRQVTHWLFAMGDTLAINTLRALAAIASHPEALERARTAKGSDPEYLAACLQEAMRLWPTTPMLAREAVRETDWRGVAVAKGTQLVIVNTYMHRDPDRHDFADRFAPGVWTEGDASGDSAFNHLSHGPQGCPGVDLVKLVGGSALAAALDERRVAAVQPRIDPRKPMPHMLDFFSIRIELSSPT